MKKLHKTLFTLGIIMLLVGGIFFLIGFGASGFDIYGISSLKTVEKTEELTAEKLIIDIEDSDIKFVFDENADKIKLTYFDTFNKKDEIISDISVLVADGVTTVKERMSWKESLFLFTKQREMTVVIPASLSLDISVSVEHGDVEFSGSAMLKSLTADAESGSIDTTAAVLNVSENIKLESEHGNIKLGDIDAQKLTVSTDNGDVDSRSGVLNVGKIYISTEHGDIRLGKITGGATLAIESDNGSTKFFGDINVSVLAIKTEHGSIKCDEGADIYSSIVTIETDNGNTVLNLVGIESNFNIAVKCINGSSNVQNREGGMKNLEIYSKNGDVKITFVGN